MRATFHCVIAVVALGACSPKPAPAIEPAPSHAPAPASRADTVGSEDSADSLAGRFLLATSVIRDPHFSGAVVLVVRHDRSGAFGLVVNRAHETRRAAELLGAMGGAAEGSGEIRVHYGGPVDSGTGFVVHSPPYRTDMTLLVGERIAVGMAPAVLDEVAAGAGPPRRFIAFGRVGWGAGQLERELAAKVWVTAPLDEEILFDDDMATKWERAMLSRVPSTKTGSTAEAPASE